MGSTDDRNLSREGAGSCRASQKDEVGSGGQEQSFARNSGLSMRRALTQLRDDIELEINRMEEEFSRRKFHFWLTESISFESELSKMRWPSVLFMTAQALAHFIVAFVLEVENLATNWVGFQGLILTCLLLFNLSVNLWDTKLRFKELLMKSQCILKLIDQCSRDKHLLKQWRQLSWQSARAKTLFIPKSPCIHQTLTYRDKSCLNLPDYLLVKGDVIHLYPGERAPSDCISLSPNRAAPEISLKAGHIFHQPGPQNSSNGPVSECDNSNPDPADPLAEERRKRDIIMQFSHAKLKRANEGVNFLVLSTPYIESLRVSLQRSHRRPVNSVEKECFIVTRKYFETFVIPSVFVLSTIVTAIHYGYLDLTDSDQKIKTISVAHLLLRPSLTIMPFLPWMFPCFWLAVNAYGSARLICFGEMQRHRSVDSTVSNIAQSPDLSARGACGPTLYVGQQQNLLATPTAGESLENKHADDELQDLSSNIDFSSIAKVFFDLIWGKGGHIWRSSNLLQVLGCLTSLCCIDKVGILSWSNPTPEKVFTLTSDDDSQNQLISGAATAGHLASAVLDCELNLEEVQQLRDAHQPTSESLLRASAVGALQEDQASSARTSVLAAKQSATNRTRAEILDVSQTANCFRGYNFDAGLNQHQCGRLQFDDLSWHKFISNLKPLGLTILMNNCNENSFGDYFRFYKHISYESILRCNLTPVVKRRCICALSKLIGFSKEAISNYKYVNQIGVYKLVDPSMVKGAKLVSSLENNTRLKLPFSNMICNIYQDVTTGSHQVFSQGTADIILDASVEYWDGRQLVPLDESAKKKIMDFYHRTSLTSYCSAFAYTPLLKGHDLGNHYVELPPENYKFAPHLRKLANEHQEEFLKNQLISLPARHRKLDDGSRKVYDSLMSTHEDYLDAEDHNQPSGCQEERLGLWLEARNRNNRILRRHMSLENLYPLSAVEEPASELFDRGLGPEPRGSRQVAKLNDTLDELTDQVFVGMVSMQYQACPDFVGLVEQLEHACIRFVHFSKENELRSRVFSEKMGLESGWNCHISLQSDRDLDKQDQDDAKDAPMKQQGSADNQLRVRFVPTPRVETILTGNSPDRANNDISSGETDSVASDDRSLYSWRSLPSLVMQIMARMSSDSRTHNATGTPDHHQNGRLHKQLQPQTGAAVGEDIAPESYFDDAEVTNLADYEPSEASAKDEAFETLAFDMSNRAKLPKGIENIRPHLETVDNVPLQVSLFTDCTPDLTKEMIEIMQDYGEIVCVIGSSSSKLNTSVFLQANASIAIEPLMPQTCTRSDDKQQRSKERKIKKSFRRQSRSKVRKPILDTNDQGNEHAVIDMRPVRLNNPRDRLGIGPSQLEPTRATGIASSKQARRSSSTSSSASSSISSSSWSSSSCRSSPDPSESDCSNEDSAHDSLVHELPGPSALASKLASLPCSYNYDRKEPVNLYSLIMEARHFTFKMKNTFVCMICFALSISSAQFLASLLFLPPMLSSGLTIWLTVVVVPLMSFSLMSTTMDSQVMKIAVGKNLQLKPENITFFVICYLIKFIPSIIVVVLSFGLIIAHSCKLTGFGSSSLGPCWMFTYVQHGNATSTDQSDQDLLWSSHLLTAQVCAAFLIVLYFVVISAGFVHRSHLMWERSPTRNKFWVLISLALIFGQLLYNQLVLQINLNSSSVPYEFLASLPAHIWAISFVCPILVIGINLLVKRAEIKATIRQQRRARFDFNTKLGMNSPF